MLIGRIIDRFRWRISENGNPTLAKEGLRLTIFESTISEGYSFCLAFDGDKQPFFSKDFSDENDARKAGLKCMRAMLYGSNRKVEKILKQFG